jgi:diguanylate cyclase (GGDEF)-like protein
MTSTTMTVPPDSDTPERSSTAIGSFPVRLAQWLAALLAVAYSVSTVIPGLRPHGENSPALDVYLYSVVLLAICGLSIIRPILVKRDRAAWWALGLGVISWSVGDLLVTLKYDGNPPVPSWGDVFYIAMYPLAYLGLVLLARSLTTRVPASVWLDGLVTSLAAGAVFTAFTLKDILAGTQAESAAGTFTNLAYPIVDLVLLVIVVATLAMLRWRRDPVLWMLGFGAALFLLADTGYLLTKAPGTYVDGMWTDGGWTLGLACIALAGTLRRPRQTPVVGGLAALLIPIVFSLAALIVLVAGTFVDLHPVTVTLAAASLVAAGVRTALTFEQTRALARSQVEAMTDEVTGLGNRRLLDDRIAALGNTQDTHGEETAAAVISIDQLTEINDTLGYTAGDTILEAVGARLAEYAPRDSVSTRLGGAEFAVLFSVTGGPRKAEETVRELLGLVAEPVAAAGMPIEVPLSAGIALRRSHRLPAQDLIRCANDALRRAKADRSEVEVYDPALDVAAEFGGQLVPELLRGLDDHQMVAFYQPTWDVVSRSVVGLEGIMRWHHPTRGVIGAEVLLPLASRAGLSRQLTRLRLAEAVRRCAAWHGRGLKLAVGVDLSAADVLDSRLPYDLARTVSEAGLLPESLHLEIDEEVLLLDPSRTERALSQFRSFGIRLVLDHYGRSAPSLSRLRTIRVDELKLDGMFVASALQSTQDAAVVRSTVDLARSLGLDVVADGIDNTDLYAELLRYGCTVMQGAAVAPPLAPNDLSQWLQEVSSQSGARTNAPV